MARESKKMKPIWYFVGMILLAMGGIIFLAGLYELFFHIKETTVFARLHSNVWWGGFMIIVGLVFLIANKTATVD